jgi:pre-rRNA-processing protein TSR2
MYLFKFQTAIEIMNYVTDYCIKNSELHSDEIKELLEDIMDQEFNTICEDDSTNEISIHLMKFLQMLKEGRIQDVHTELLKLPACVMWIKKGNKITYVPVDDDSDSSFDYDDSVAQNTQGPSTSGSTTQMMEEDVDPGWTVVRGKR